MDPNNGQEPNIQTPSQPAVPPVQQPAPIPTQTPPNPVSAASPPMAQVSKNGSKKGIILLLLLIILALGMGSYILFAKNQLNTTQKTSSESNTSTAIPTSTIVPTEAIVISPAAADDVNVASPDADLKSIEKDLQEL